MPKPSIILVQGDYWHYNAPNEYETKLKIAYLESYFGSEINGVYELRTSKMPTPDMAYMLVRRKLRVNGTKSIYDENQTGADFNFEMQMLDDNDNPIDLSNYTWKGQIRERPESGLAYDFTIYTVPSQGRVSLYMPAELTEKIMFHDGKYDLFYTDTITGQRECLIHGDVDVTWKVTEL